MRSAAMPRSAMKRAQSAWPTVEKVQEPISVTWRRRRSALTSRVTVSSSPTKQALPHVRTQRTACRRASGEDEASSDRSAPSPPVRSRMACTGSATAAGSIVLAAPNSVARARRSGLVSSAMTRAPKALASCVAASPTGPWPKIAMVSSPWSPRRCSAPPGGAGAAGDRRAGLEGELVRQRHEGAGRAFHESRMGAVPGDVVDLGDALDAELHPAGRAVPADAAAAVVMLHHPHSDPRLPLGHAGPDGGDDAAGLVPGDHRPAAALEAERRGAAGSAVEFEIAAAHAGSIDLDHDLARTGGGIGKIEDLDPPVAGQHHALHGFTLRSCPRAPMYAAR